MKTIHKFELKEIRNEISMPLGAIIRKVDLQYNATCLWVEVDTDKPKEIRTFAVTMTGCPIPDGAAYVGTTLSENPAYVTHVYEMNKAESSSTLTRELCALHADLGEFTLPNGIRDGVALVGRPFPEEYDLEDHIKWQFEVLCKVKFIYADAFLEMSKR